ncbi:MAG: hypothetical protein WD530_04180 [Vicingaceae bacterium]
MKLPVVKKLVNDHSMEQLEAAENAILEEAAPVIDVEGEDEGEQLTHVMAAIWIKREMEANDLPLNKAMRDYTVKVRNSIS